MNDCLLTFSVCFSLLISRGLFVSVSLRLCVCVSFSQSLLLSFSVRVSPTPLPGLSSSNGPVPAGPAPATPTSQELPGWEAPSDQRPEPGSGGWAWLLRPSLGLCPLHRPPQVLPASASGGVRAAQR